VPNDSYGSAELVGYCFIAGICVTPRQLGMKTMNEQDTPLGKFGYLVLPFGIVLVLVWGATWLTIIVAAATGALIANVRATLFVEVST
jgi:hypothetical protein